MLLEVQHYGLSRSVTLRIGYGNLEVVIAVTQHLEDCEELSDAQRKLILTSNRIANREAQV